MLETTRIHSVAGVLDSTAGLVTQRPSVRPGTRSQMSDSSAAASFRVPAKSLLHTTVFFFSMTSRVSAQHARSDATAARGPHCHHRPRHDVAQLPGALHARRGNERVPLRLL